MRIDLGVETLREFTHVDFLALKDSASRLIPGERVEDVNGMRMGIGSFCVVVGLRQDDGNLFTLWVSN